MRKTTTKQKLRKEADKLWYLKYLKSNCEVCNSSGGVLQGHHYYYKGSYGHLRYLKENHITLCRGCHFILHHQDPHLIEDEIINKKGKKWLAKLKKKAYNRPIGSYLTIKHYQDIIEQLKNLPYREATEISVLS